MQICLSRILNINRSEESYTELHRGAQRDTEIAWIYRKISVALCESSGFPLCKFLIDKTY